MLRRFLGYVRPYWPALALSVLATLVYVSAAAMLVWLIGPLVNTLFGGDGGSWDVVSTGSITVGGFFNSIKRFVKDTLEGLVRQETPLATLTRLAWIIVLISLLKNAFRLIGNYIVAWVQQRIVYQLRTDLFSHYHDLSISYFSRTNTGTVISRVTNDVGLLTDMLDLGFNRLIKDPLTVLVLLFSLFIISWKLTLLALLVLPATWIVIVLIGRAIRKTSGRAQENMAEVATILEESISGIRVVKAFVAKRFEENRFARAARGFFREMVWLIRLRSLNSPINEFFVTVAGVVILYVGGRQVVGGAAITADEFMTYFFLIFSMLTPIKALAGVHVKIQEGAAAIERIFRALDTEPEVIDAPNAKPITKFNRAITFQKVEFAYHPGLPVLRDISFSLPKGKMVALVGPSGGGKSTLCDLLARFYDPTAGRILVDGRDLRSFEIDSWRRLLGIVTQETILFNETVARNIAYGVEEIDREKLRAAAHAAHALDFIEEMPRGFDTVIGPRGIQLSGGQRQRLAIARAIMKDPRILIFDEATSALDTESEAMVQKAINNLVQNRTTLVVAHRLSTIRQADEIVVVAAGIIVQRGTHVQLLAEDGLYKKLYDLQFQDEVVEQLQ